MRQAHPGLWRVIYIARDEKQAERIEKLLTDSGFMVDHKRPSAGSDALTDIEIKVLDAEAQEARLFLMEQGF